MYRLTELLTGSVTSAVAFAAFALAQLFPTSPDAVRAEVVHLAPEHVVVEELRVVEPLTRDHDLDRLRERSPFASLAARSLAAEGDRRAVPVLASLLRSARAGRRVDDVMLRHACIDALRTFGGPEAVRALEETVASPVYSSLVAPAARALGSIGGRESRRVLLEVARDLARDGDRVLDAEAARGAADALARQSLAAHPLS